MTIVARIHKELTPISRLLKPWLLDSALETLILVTTWN